MHSLSNLIAEIDERNIAIKIGIKHDETRMQYSLKSNTVGSYEKFINELSKYYNSHFARCNSIGGIFSDSEAAQRSKEIVEKEYQSKRKNINNAYNDAHEGTNGGMRAILDIITNSLKMESTHRYIQDAFDRYVSPNSWPDKVQLIRQFIEFCGPHL